MFGRFEWRRRRDARMVVCTTFVPTVQACASGCAWQRMKKKRGERERWREGGGKANTREKYPCARLLMTMLMTMVEIGEAGK